MSKFIIKARLILEKDGKVLLLAQTNQNGGKFTLPGGTVENKEYTKATLIRECHEEIGIKLDGEKLDLVHVLHKKKGKENRMTIYFSTNAWQDLIITKERDKFQGADWFSIHSLPPRTSTTVRHVIQQFLLRKTYSELRKK